MDVDEPVEIVSYDPAWRALAVNEITRLRAQLAGRELAIEHVGSTAVDGCGGKPIVDLLVGVDDHARQDVAAAIEAAGYESLGEAEPGRIYLRRRSSVCFNVHVVAADSGLWRDNILFREYLRASPDARDRYVTTKLAAAAAEPRLLAYSRLKAPLIAELLVEARGRAIRP